MPKARVSARTPVEAYFWLDFRRRWTARRALSMAAVLLVLVAIQTAVSWVAMKPTLLQSPQGMWVLEIASRLHLMNSWGALLNPDGFHSSPSTSMTLWFVFSGVVYPLLTLVMPAVLSTSIATEREQLRLEDVRLTALTPGEILLAKGLSCALPFVAIAVVYALIDVVTLFLLRVPAMSSVQVPAAFSSLAYGGSTEFSRKLYIFSIFTNSVLGTVLLVVRASILVCASALCSRVTTALILGFAVVLVAEPLLESVIGWVVAALTPQDRGLRDLVEIVLRLACELAALRMIIPFAIRAIDPGGEAALRDPASASTVKS